MTTEKWARMQAYRIRRDKHSGLPENPTDECIKLAIRAYVGPLPQSWMDEVTPHVREALKELDAQ